MHPRQPSPTHPGLNPDEAIQCSPLTDDAISYASSRNSQYSPRSRLSPFDGDSDIPMLDNPFIDGPLINDDPLVNDDPLLNDNPPINENPLINDEQDLPFARSPSRTESDEINILHHPLINGVYPFITPMYPYSIDDLAS
jgi:hypothetical protein